MATLDDLATFLASAGCGTAGTTLFKGQLPATPDAIGAILEYPGSPPDFVFGQSAIATEYPRVQVAFRGSKLDYVTPRALAETAYRALGAAANRLLGTTFYQVLEPLQPPFLIRKDENDRFVIGFNVAISKELTA